MGAATAPQKILLFRRAQPSCSAGRMRTCPPRTNSPTDFAEDPRMLTAHRKEENDEAGVLVTLGGPMGAVVAVLIRICTNWRRLISPDNSGRATALSRRADVHHAFAERHFFVARDFDEASDADRLARPLGSDELKESDEQDSDDRVDGHRKCSPAKRRQICYEKSPSHKCSLAPAKTDPVTLNNPQFARWTSLQ